MKKYLLILILLVGCEKHIPDANLQIHENAQTFTQITQKPIDDEKVPVIGNKEPETVIAIITVPASTVETTVIVYDKKKPLRPRAKSESKRPVDIVTNNENVKAEYPEVTPWWYWWIAFVIGAIVTYFAGKKYYGLILEPIKWVTKIWAWLKNK